MNTSQPPKNATDYLYNYNTDNYMDLKNPEIRQAKKELLKDAYSPAKRCQEIVCFLLFITFLPMAFVNFISNTANGLSVVHALPIILGFICGLLFSDFMSGLVHWGADTWGNLEWPLVGKTFIRSFREHHVAPSAMCNHDLIETNGDNFMLVAYPLYSLCRTDVLRNSSDGITPPWFDVFTYCFWLSAAVGVALTNQIHKWSHTFRPPTVVVWLQNSGLILPKDNHLLHHRPAFDGYYCITTGWLNPVLEKIQFWKITEQLVSKVTGLIPREDDYKWTGLVDETPDVVLKFLENKKSK